MLQFKKCNSDCNANVTKFVTRKKSPGELLTLQAFPITIEAFTSLLFHKLIYLSLNSRIAVSGSSKSVLTVCSISPFATDNFSRNLLNGFLLRCGRRTVYKLIYLSLNSRVAVSSRLQSILTICTISPLTGKDFLS